MTLLTPDRAARRRQGGGPLASWKSIAGYLGVSVRTVQRWQAEGLPVHRRPGGTLGSVHAFADELDNWLRSRERAVPIPDAPSPGVPSVAVLPLTNLGDRKTEAFADGLTDGLIHTLSGGRGLRVLARSTMVRFKGTENSRQVGLALSADYVLEGTVRASGRRVRVTVSLVAVRDGVNVSSRRFDRRVDEMFDVQDEIASEVARALELALAPPPSRPTGTATEGYQAYLEARYALHKGNLRSALHARDLYEQAIRCDPHHAASHCGLAYSLVAPYIWGLVGPESAATAVEAARRAVELSPELSETHSVLGLVRGICEWDWSAAGHHGRIALDLNRNLPDNWYRYTQGYLLPTGRLEEAIDSVRRAARLDPLSPFIQSGLAWTYLTAGRPADALAACRRVLQLDPLNVKARWSAAWAHQLEGRHDEAVRECETAREYAGVFPFMLAQLGRAYALAAREADARRCLADLEALAEETYTPRFCFAHILLGLGEVDDALGYLEAAIEDREPHAFFLAAPVYDPVRRHRRFRRLVSRVGVTA